MAVQKAHATFMVLTGIVIAFPTSLSLADAKSDSSMRIERLEAAVSALEKRVSALEGPSDESNKPQALKEKTAGNWKSKSSWRLLSRGMSKAQVAEILGEPETIEASGPIDHWIWEAPLGPKVTFYNDVVYGWEEP